MWDLRLRDWRKCRRSGERRRHRRRLGELRAWRCDARGWTPRGSA